jgi:RNA polymerase sigma factor (sigma-70 family)
LITEDMTDIPRRRTDLVDTTTESAIQSVTSSNVWRFINQLPASQRDQIIYVLQERPLAEIAAELGISEDAVKSRRSYALRTLRKLIETENYEE